MNNSSFIIVTLSIILLALLPSKIHGSSDDVVECEEVPKTLTSDSGYLSIKREPSKKCAFLSNSSYLVIETSDLNLYPGEKLTYTPEDVKYSPVYLSGPQDYGYLVSGMPVQLKFEFPSNVSYTKNTRMLVKFYQGSTSPLNILVDKHRDLAIKNVVASEPYKARVVKTIDDPIHLKVVGQGSSSQSLMDKSDFDFQIQSVGDVRLEASPALKSCSGNHLESKAGDSVEIAGPDGNALKDVASYKCVHIFKTTDPKAHFDVDFKNFIELMDQADELSISDGSQTLKINQLNQRYYTKLTPLVSFKGTNLVVAYDSPQKIARLQTPFKLSVHGKSSGGIVDSFDYKFDMPTTKAPVFYSLRTPPKGSENVMLEFTKFKGVIMTIFNRQGKQISLGGKNFPPQIVFTRPDDDISFEFSTDKEATSGTVSYKQAPDCGGTLFEPSGTISAKGSNKTCYWFLGKDSNVVNFNFNDLQSGGSIEIYDLQQESPLYSKDDVSSTETLPPVFINRQAYLKVKFGSRQGSFDASISEKTNLQVSSQSGPQTILTSVGYPVSYFWSDESESNTFGAKGKQVVLSVADLDLRDGEKVMVNGNAVSKDSVPVDFPLSEQIEVKTQRSVSKDFNFHRGYKMVTTEFQAILTARMAEKTLKTPTNNITSVLVKIPAESGMRVSYDISAPNTSNYVMRVFDSESIMGSQVEDAEKLKGSTTARVMLVSLRSSKEKESLPEFTINYSQVPCDKTKDHVCDGSTRCVPAYKMCKGVAYCMDGSDLKVPCSNGPAPPPKIIEKGLGGVTVFILSVLMFTIGVIAALYGPDLYKNFESRYRAGHYTTFQSTE